MGNSSINIAKKEGVASLHFSVYSFTAENNYSILSPIWYQSDNTTLLFVKSNSETAGSKGYELQIYNKYTGNYTGKKFNYIDEIFELSFYILNRKFLIAQKDLNLENKTYLQINHY